jgi:predicted AlkP superfamily phosphohydrolase/phosphomutase
MHRRALQTGRPARLAPLLLALLALLALCAGCGGEPAGRAEQRFGDLADFLARAERPAAQPRLVVIGIDGASWDYIDPLIEAGELPNLARLRRDGASARLRSIDCHFTPPAWTTLFSGRLPAKTGVYHFGRWDAAAREFRSVSARDVAVPSLQDVVSAAGLRVASVGVPLGYPARAVAGVMVGGLETPKNHGPRLDFRPAERRVPPRGPQPPSFSPPLGGALEDARNVLFPVFVDSRDDGRTEYDRVSLRVVEKGPGPPAARTLGSYEFALGEFSPWVRLRAVRDGAPEDVFVRLQFLAPHGDFGFRISPAFFRIRDPFTYPPELAAELEQRFGYYLPHEFLSLELVPFAARDAAEHARWFLAREDWDVFLFVFGDSDNAHHLAGFGDEVLPVYRTIDSLLGELLDGLDPRTTLAVVSDHGFGRFDEAVDLNRFLAEQGLLRWRRPGVIDHDQSVVFHQMWHLYFEPRLLTPDELTRRGVELRAGETPRQALARHLADAAKAIRAPDGRELPIELVPLPDSAVRPAPDMAVKSYPDGVWVEFWNLERPSESVVTRLAEGDRWKHARDGILALYGAQIRPGRLETQRIEDVAPTLLDLLGLPVADALDGRPIAALLDEASAARPLARVPEFPPRAPLPDEPEAREQFEATLRALGYTRD